MGEGQGTRPQGQEAKSKSPSYSGVRDLEKWCWKSQEEKT